MTLMERRRALMAAQGGETWDYEWFASSGVLPTGMIATSTNWAAHNEYADIQNPVYDIGYADMELEIECAWITMPQIIFAANTQIVASSSAGFAAKIFAEASTGKICFFGHENGATAVVYPDVSRTVFHVYRLRLDGGKCTLHIDGIMIAERDAYSSQYNGAPIISTADTSSGRTNRLAIKTIRWRKIA